MVYLISFLSSLFASITIILSKKSISDIDTNLILIIRTSITLLISFFIIIFTGNINNFFLIDKLSFIYLILSGICTFLCYFFFYKATIKCNINDITGVDKISIIITIFISVFLFDYKISLITIISIILILLGIFLMINKYSKYLILALLSGVFASFMTSFAKLGLVKINSTISTFIRSFVVILFLLPLVKIKNIKQINKNNLIYIILSGISISLSWFLYYYSLKIGNTVIVMFFDRISIVFTIIMSFIFFKEKPILKNIIGLILIILGGLLLLI